MPFVNELIPEETLKTFDFSIFTGFLGPRKLESWEQPKWTIDRERDAFLFYVDGGGGPHLGCPRQEAYGFWWNGNVATVQADEVVTKDSRGQLLTWDNVKLFLKPEIEFRRDEFKELIREAMDAKGLGYERSYVYAVNVNFTN